MNNTDIVLYGLCWAAALILALILTPAARTAAISLGILDRPDQKLKTHQEAVPYLGGIAIFIAFIFSLSWIRILTHFPTGTLKSIRGIFLGANLVALIGLMDDSRKGGLHFKTKFLLQTLTALVLIVFDVRIKFAHPIWLADILTIIWVIGITNALNLLDIMDGLAAGVAAIASLAFLFISLPSEEIYVNFTAAALAGACMGFLPYNLSKKQRIFMGDTGSLVLGYVLAALSMGTSYTKINSIGLLSPFLILALPIYDTLLVSWLRLKKGQSPFIGSKDHFALRLKALGWSLPKILGFCYAGAFAAAVGAYLMTQWSNEKSVLVLAFFLGLALLFSWRISKVSM